MTDDLNGWAVRYGVMCVECPRCSFTFDAWHEDQDGGYTCPKCEPFPLDEEQLAQVVELVLPRIIDKIEAEAAVSPFDDSSLGEVERGIMPSASDMHERIRRIRKRLS